ncbi:MAG: prepilin-type N-terminal cleavage/methylation domain-containing protein [Candidatus Omnitrophica bacterium]|nr:prepilin-type N-terminal cleavage/methylation domain-containing protein [Candidatus Omnitrophota bacterium]
MDYLCFKKARHKIKRFPCSGEKIKNGFSLIEVICVVFIISLLISISVPFLSKTARNFYFKNKVKQIESLLKFVKKKAILEDLTYKFELNYYKNSYIVWVKKQEGESSYYEIKTDSLLGIKKLSEQIYLKAESKNKENDEIVFNSQGSATFCEFYLSDNSRRAKITTTLSGEIILEFL